MGPPVRSQDEPRERQGGDLRFRLVILLAECSVHRPNAAITTTRRREAEATCANVRVRTWSASGQLQLRRLRRTRLQNVLPGRAAWTSRQEDTAMSLLPIPLYVH